MPGGFVKLYGTILDSSVWAEDSDTRIVWVTLLTMADKNGRVDASHGGLARRANVSRDATERAIAILEAPDPDDRSGIEEGRRIRAVQGGWEIINYARYREIQTERQAAEAAKKRKQRARRGGRDSEQGDNGGRLGDNGDASPPSPLDADAKAKAEAESSSSSSARAQNGAPPLLNSADIAYAAREFTIAANRGMQDNPDIGERHNPINVSSGASYNLAEAALRAGVDPVWAKSAIYTAAKRYTPDRPGAQISTMSYFRGVVIDGYERFRSGQDAKNGDAPAELPHSQNGTRGRNLPADAGRQSYDAALRAAQSFQPPEQESTE